MWRHDKARTSSSPTELPEDLDLLWIRQYTPRTPVWDDPLNQDIMPYDRIFEPVVADGVLVIGFNDSDKIVALDTNAGGIIWTYYTDGPVRLPPVLWNGKVYATSDDGHMYCINLRTGQLVWKFRGGPSDRRVLGNGRLISMWPARGGPVVEDGVVYFAASIWPFMGIFIYALDAETGEIIWVNDAEGSRYMPQPHNAPSFAGIAPQGAMTISGNRLLISGGRTVPSCFDKTTGEFLYYELLASGKTGGSFVAAWGNYFFNHYRERMTSMYYTPTGGTLVTNIGKYPVLTSDRWYFSGESIKVIDAASFDRDMHAVTAGENDSTDYGDLGDRAAKSIRENMLWEIDVNAEGDLIRAGSTLYAAGDGVITSVDLNSLGKPTVAWRKIIHGDIERLIAADGKLFAVTLDGRIMSFGANPSQPASILEKPPIAGISDETAVRVKSILDQTGITEGYAVVYGVDDGTFLEALATWSDLHIVAIDPDEHNVQTARRRLDERRLYGVRVAVHCGQPFEYSLPPYLFSLTVVNDQADQDRFLDENSLNRFYESMRPYGGSAWISARGSDRNRISTTVSGSGLHGAVTEILENAVIIRREGSLPGSAVWTHNLGDIANTAKSDDDRVKLPLGLLWFGGNSNMDILPRAGHGPAEQVIGGMLFIEGINSLSARDVYTGRVIWKRMFYDLGTYNAYFDHTYRNTPTIVETNQIGLPGADIRGTNYIATEDLVYIINGNERATRGGEITDCHVLDAATGETVNVFRLPPVEYRDQRIVYSSWGYIGVYEDYLIAGTNFVPFSDLLDISRAEYVDNHNWKNLDLSASEGLVVMDRYSGEILWKKNSNHGGFLHNGIIVGDGVLYCLDKVPPLIEEQFSRRGEEIPSDFRLSAFDIRTGETIWEETATVFGSFLSYSKEHRLLIQSTRPSHGTVRGEQGKRIVVYQADHGDILWDRAIEYQTFPILHGDRIVTESGIFNLLDGDPVPRSNPLTGESVPWTWKRMYGCNFPIASEHLLTFRSGAAGFYDFTNAGGTGNFGGIRSGCTNTLVAADGVLNFPDYTRTCQCAYQNQASVALVHMPDADIEIWTYDTHTWDGAPLERIGVNLGAPGDRLTEAGTLWLDIPVVGGDSPDIPVSVEPAEDVAWYRRHMSRIDGDGIKWVAASGGEGIERVTVPLAADSTSTRSFTVRLHFCEPDESVQAGSRVFDVKIQGNNVEKNLDIVKETGGAYRSLVREINGVRAEAAMYVELAVSSSSRKKPVLSGIEIVSESDTVGQ